MNKQDLIDQQELRQTILDQITIRLATGGLTPAQEAALKDYWDLYVNLYQFVEYSDSDIVRVTSDEYLNNKYATVDIILNNLMEV